MRIKRLKTHFDYPNGSLLFAAKDSLCPDDASLGINGAVDGVYADDVCAFGVGIFVPHANNYMGPGMARG